MTEQEYDAILASQHGLCAICDEAPVSRQLAVDHDHKTGKVRGLLCGRCNTMLGMAGENYDIFCEASLYLSRHKSQATRAVGLVANRIARSRIEDEAGYREIVEDIMHEAASDMREDLACGTNEGDRT